MACILKDQELITRRIEVAKALNLSLPPMMNDFCQECSQWHAIQIPEEHCDQRFGRPPADVPVKPEGDKYFDRKYCDMCHAYHNRDNLCPGGRQLQDWDKKEI